MIAETRALPAAAERVWDALTAPEQVARWWGTLDLPLRPGRLSLLDMGDGDTYALEVVALDPPHRLQYRRRLFGIDSKQPVRWEVAEIEGGSLVTVTLDVVDADDDGHSALYEECRSLLQRLEQFLTGTALPPTPGDREFVLGTELPGEPAAVRALLGESLSKRLGLAGSPFTTAGHGTLAGDGEVRIRVRPGETTELELSHPAWPSPTSARIAVHARGQGTRVVIRHRGWAGTATDDEQRRRHRARFADFWHKLLLHFTLAYARSWQIPVLTATELKDRMADPGLIVLDANRATLWERGHVPEAVFVGQEDLPLDRLPADQDAELVFYCRDSMCLTAYLSAAKARTLGYRNTAVLKGGRAAWAEAGYPLVAEEGA